MNEPHPPHWVPGWLTLAITGAAGFLLGVVVLVLARGVVHDKTQTVTRTHTRTVVVTVTPKVPNVVGETIGDARGELERKGYRVVVTGGGFFGAGDGDTVASQDPPAGAEVGGGATVTVDAG